MWLDKRPQKKIYIKKSDAGHPDDNLSPQAFWSSLITGMCGKTEWKTDKLTRPQMFNFLLFEMLHTILVPELSLAFAKSI